MRSIIFLAFLGLVLSQTVPTEVTELINSFGGQLGFTDDQNTDGSNCVVGFLALSDDISLFVQAVDEMNSTNVITYGFALLQDLQPVIDDTCAPYFQDLLTYEANNQNAEDTETNIIFNFPFILQELGKIVENGESGDLNVTALGESLATIYQISIGAINPSEDANTKITEQQQIDLEAKLANIITTGEGLDQIIDAYLQSFGVNTTTVNISSIVAIVQEIPNFFVEVMALQAEYQTGTYDSGITALQGFITNTLEIVRRNKDGVSEIVTLLYPSIENLEADPEGTIISSVMSIALNDPLLAQLDNELVQETLDSDYAAIGQTLAKITKIFAGEATA